jgi:nitrite reductase/ring-hydroxylating ferredoxin subunit
VRLRLQGSCKSCPSSSMTLKLAIEEAIYEAAPDVAAIEAEGVMEQPANTQGFVPLERIRGAEETRQPAANGHGWEEVGGLASLTQGSVRTIEVAGRALLFCQLDGTFYAYGNLCPGCGQTLQGAYLEANSIVCNACGQRYDCVGAGRGRAGSLPGAFPAIDGAGPREGSFASFRYKLSFRWSVVLCGEARCRTTAKRRRDDGRT